MDASRAFGMTQTVSDYYRDRFLPPLLTTSTGLNKTTKTPTIRIPPNIKKKKKQNGWDVRLTWTRDVLPFWGYVLHIHGVYPQKVGHTGSRGFHLQTTSCGYAGLYL